MEKQRGRKRLVTAAVTLSIVMLALIVGTLAALFSPHGDMKTGRTGALVEGMGNDGTLGMVLIDIVDDDTAAFYHVSEKGVYVLAVEENSQAYQAGVRSGDRIVSANSVDIGVSGDLSALQAGLASGDTLVLSLSRGIQGHLLTVTLDIGANVSV